jgi:uncharacterized protein YndB with AHSA1/START domain
MKPTITRDLANKTITVEKIFSAPRSNVWAAWTTQEMLEKWWAPKPWLAVTKSFDFKSGGAWHYYMLGPDGTQSWGLMEYTNVEPENVFSGTDGFVDENGVKNSELPSAHWNVEFFDQGEQTKVICTLTFQSVEDLEKLTSLGFEEGFTMGLGNLDEVLAE